MVDMSGVRDPYQSYLDIREELKEYGMHLIDRPEIIVASKMDDERADFYKSFNGMVAKFGTMVCPVVIPVITGGKVASYYNMISGKAFAYNGFKAQEVEAKPDDQARFDAIKEVFNEAVAGTDEDIMEKYFSGEELTAEDRLKGIKIGVADGSIIPVFALSGQSGEACDQLLDFILFLLLAQA